MTVFVSLWDENEIAESKQMVHHLFLQIAEVELA